MRHLGLNRIRTKADLIQANELTPDLAEFVFSRLHPLAHREDGEPLYLESAVDRAIEMVVGRHGPATHINDSFFASVPWTRLANQLCEFLDKAMKNQEPMEAVKQVEEEWLDVDKAAKQLNRSAPYVRGLCRKQIFGKKDAGGRWWIHRKEVEKFLSGRTLVHGEGCK